MRGNPRFDEIAIKPLSALLPPRSPDWNRSSVFIHCNKNETPFAAQLAPSGQQIFGPKLDLDGHRCPTCSADSAYNFSQLALTHRLVKIDAFRTGRHNRLPRMTRSRNERSHVHQPQRVAAKKRTVVIGLVRKHHLNDACFRRLRKIRSRHGKPLRPLRQPDRPKRAVRRNLSIPARPAVP